MQNDTQQNEGENTQKDVNEKKMMQNDTIEKVKQRKAKWRENRQNVVSKRKRMQNDTKS